MREGGVCETSCIGHMIFYLLLPGIACRSGICAEIDEDFAWQLAYESNQPKLVHLYWKLSDGARLASA